MVVKQRREAFAMLTHALQILNGSEVTEILHGDVRVMTSIMQVQRFEIAVSSFANC